MTQTEPRPPTSSLDAENEGYKQSLTRRQVQMIAIGGAIGTGLFLGSASRLHSTGPALLFSYAFVGIIAYFLMRALGELVLHRPTSGAFVSYMREFYGESGAYITGWMYWLNWALTGIAELSAVALYVQFWGPILKVTAIVASWSWASSWWSAGSPSATTRPASRTCGATRAASGPPPVISPGTGRSW